MLDRAAPPLPFPVSAPGVGVGGAGKPLPPGDVAAAEEEVVTLARVLGDSGPVAPGVDVTLAPPGITVTVTTPEVTVLIVSVANL